MRRLVALFLVVSLSLTSVVGAVTRALLQPPPTPIYTDGDSLPINWGNTPSAFCVAATTTCWFFWSGAAPVAGAQTRVVEVATCNTTTSVDCSAASAWRGNYVVSTQGLVNDNHGSPAAIRDGNGCEWVASASHNSVIQLAVTQTADDPTSFVNIGPIPGSVVTFPNMAAASSNIYLFYSGAGAGADLQEALSYYTQTPTGCVPGAWAAVKTMFDSAAAAGHGWLIPGNFIIDPANPTNIYFVWVWAPTTGAVNNFSNVYLAYLDTVTGNVCNWGGVTCIIPASQPISLATMNSTFQLVSQGAGQGGEPGLTIVGGVFHVQYHTFTTQFDIRAAGPAGSWSAPATLFTVNTGTSTDALRPCGARDNGLGSGAVDYFCADGTFGATAATAASDAGNIWRIPLSSAGVVGGPQMVQAASPLLGNAVTFPVYNGTTNVGVIWTQVVKDLTTLSGSLQGFVYGASGLVRRPQQFGLAIPPNISKLDPANTSVNATLLAGLAMTTTITNNSGVVSRSLSAKSSGQFYVEAHITVGSIGAIAFGILNASQALTGVGLGLNGFNSLGWYSSGPIRINSTILATYQTAGAGNTCGVAIDFGLSKFWERCVLAGTLTGWNNDILANQNPATGTGGTSFSTLTGGPFYFGVQAVTAGNKVAVNFGQTPFQMTPPAGFAKWNFLLKRDLDPIGHANDNSPVGLGMVG